MLLHLYRLRLQASGLDPKILEKGGKSIMIKIGSFRDYIELVDVDRFDNIEEPLRWFNQLSEDQENMLNLFGLSASKFRDILAGNSGTEGIMEEIQALEYFLENIDPFLTKDQMMFIISKNIR